MAARDIPPRSDNMIPENTQVSVGIFGDNLTCINWLNGNWACKDRNCTEIVAQAQRRVATWWARGQAVPMVQSSDWAGHVFREHNQEADKLAHRGRQGIERNLINPKHFPMPQIAHVRAHFDGSCGNETDRAGGGWVIWVQPRSKYGPRAWVRLAERSFPVHASYSTCAELLSLSDCIRGLDHVLTDGQVKFATGTTSRRKR